MAIILNIDTSQNGLYISVGKSGQSMANRSDAGAANQAALLNVYVQEVLQEADITFNQLQAVAVLTGPGSYTGLRIGMASAKGYCMALDIPLIAIDNLYALAYDYAIQNTISNQTVLPIFIPMTNEVIYAKYAVQKMKENPILELLIATTHSKEILLASTGDYVIKNSKNLHEYNGLNAISADHNQAIVNIISEQFYSQKIFADLILAEPNYAKEAFIQESKK
jgi:tRNA threonylcarbamoyladenosine biosynthesis protein TsaB